MRRSLKKVQRDLEKQIRAKYPESKLTWPMPLMWNKDRTGGGRLLQEEKGYNPKTHMVHIRGNGSWYTL